MGAKSPSHRTLSDDREVSDSKSAKELLAALGDLRHSITAEAAKRIERWQPDIEQPSFAASAGNLAHYLAFRHHDLRELQRELMRHGLSSLGRLESRVMVTLHDRGERTGGAAVRRANGIAGLAALQRKILPWRGAVAGERACPAGRHGGHGAGRIMVTLPTEAAHDPGYMLEIARRGADVVRINCAHDGADAWAAMIENTRKAGDAVGRRIRVLMDIAGPKFRIGKVKRQPGERMLAGDRFRLVADAAAFTDRCDDRGGVRTGRCAGPSGGRHRGVVR